MRNLSVTAKLLVLVALPLAGLAFFGVWVSAARWRVYRDNVALEQNSAVLQQIGATVHDLQKERGRSAGFLGGRGTVFAVELREQRLATDHALATLGGLLRGFDAAAFGPAFGAQLQAATQALDELAAKRAGIDALSLAPDDSLAYYTGTISRLLDVVVGMSHLSDDAAIGNGISCYVNFLQAKEQAGIERATATGVFTADRFTADSFTRFNQVMAAQTTYLRVFESFATAEQRRFNEETVQGPAVEAVRQYRRLALERSATGQFGVAPQAWFEASTARIDLMKTVEDRLGRDYARAAEAIKFAARRHFVLSSLATLAILAATVFASWRIARAIIRPVAALQRGFARIALGDLGSRVSVESTDELGQLSAAANAMAGGCACVRKRGMLSVRSSSMTAIRRRISGVLRSSVCSVRSKEATWTRWSSTRSTV